MASIKLEVSTRDDTIREPVEKRLFVSYLEGRPVLVPEAVYDEAVHRGQEEGYPDALAVQKATEDCIDVVAHSAAVVQTAEQLWETAKLGGGAMAAIALTRNRDARCLTDDHAARTTAASIGIDVGGTIFVLLEARPTGILSGDDYVARIDELSNSGCRISASLYRRAIEAGTNLDSSPDQ